MGDELPELETLLHEWEPAPPVQRSISRSVLGGEAPSPTHRELRVVRVCCDSLKELLVRPLHLGVVPLHVLPSEAEALLVIGTDELAAARISTSVARRQPE